MFQHTYSSEVRAALDMWADRVAGIVGRGAKVLPLKKVSNAQR